MRWPFPNPRRAFQNVRDRLKARVSRWVRKRQGFDQLPLTLRSRRIYILPTGVGVTFAIVCVAMLLGSMNYNNSMGFALTFLLAAVGLVAMHRCHQNLMGLRIVAASAKPVFAGDDAEFQLLLENSARTERTDIEAYVGETVSDAEDVPNSGNATLSVFLKTQQRGRATVERFGLRTRFPFSLLNTWSWLYVATSCIVWPSPATDAPTRPPAPSRDSGSQRGAGDDDFAGLRDYRDGDSPRLIAWKALARNDQLKSRQLEGGGRDIAWIDWDTAPGSDLEHRLSILARWVLDAERAGERYGLRLPGTEIPPDSGLSHRNHCLDVLALYSAPEDIRYA